MAASYRLTIAEMRVPAPGPEIGIVMPDDFPLVSRFLSSYRYEAATAAVSMVLRQKRLMEARMSSAVLCHRNGFGSSLTALMYSAIARSNSAVDR